MERAAFGDFMRVEEPEGCIICGEPATPDHKHTLVELDHRDGYDSLRRVYDLAVEQAARGKGFERHATEGQAFDDQDIVQENVRLGSIHFGVGQARKKALEANRLGVEAAKRELLGAMNYLAGAYRYLEMQPKQEEWP
jgi:hypothetical protein